MWLASAFIPFQINVGFYLGFYCDAHNVVRISLSVWMCVHSRTRETVWVKCDRRSELVHAEFNAPKREYRKHCLDRGPMINKAVCVQDTHAPSNII